MEALRFAAGYGAHARLCPRRRLRYRRNAVDGLDHHIIVFSDQDFNRTPDVEANLPWLASRPAPRVDVLICTYNEDRLILEQTIVGAMSLAYPDFRVWVCDDGRREWLRLLCEEHGCGYITRKGNAHAKAGNINNALVYLHDLGSPPEFISILDADFVPRPEFLTRAMALMRDPSIGIVRRPSISSIWIRSRVISRSTAFGRTSRDTSSTC